MKKILIIISTLILILSFSRVKAESYTSLVWSQYWRNRTTPLTYDSGKGYYYTQTTNFPVYIFLNDQASQSGGGLQLPSNARRIRFHIRILSYNSNPTLQYVYNSYTIGTYYDKGGLTYCDTVQANNYNINQLDYTNQLDLTLDCPIVKTSTNLSVIFIRGNDTSSGYPYRIDINPNYTLVYDDATEGIQGVIEQQQDTNDILNETIQYNTQTNTNTIGANETLQAGAMEDQLIQQNEFNGSILDNMSINSSASGFIWQIMEGLRGMNVAIVSLMTMALGLGVIKLVLNR